MALRNIVKDGDPILLKKSREVQKFDQRLHTLLDDMQETLYESGGVGLAGVQVGVLRRIAVIDVGEGLIEFINPKIIDKKGTHQVVEGCLSFPDQYGIVERPVYVKTEYFDRFGKKHVVDGEDLFAQAMCHEFDHMDGVVFKSKVLRMLSPEELEQRREE